MSFIDEEHDAELLNNLGRKADIINLRGSTLDDEIRLLVLLGKSGSGKSSVLRAGVKWEVQKIGGKEICYWQASPEATIDHLTKTVNGSFTDFQQVWESFLKPLSTEPSTQPIKLDKLRILIMDHFDFLRPDYSPHKAFFDLIERICNDPSPHRVKCVIAFREEYWPHWHAFLPRLKANSTVNEVRLAPLHTARAQVVMHGILTRAGFSASKGALNRFVSGVAEGSDIRPVWIQVGSKVLSRWAESSLLWRVSQSRYLRAGGVKGVIAEHLQHHFREVAPSDCRRLLQAVSGSLIDKATGNRNMAGVKVEDLAKENGLDPVDLRALAATNRRILERVDSHPNEEGIAWLNSNSPTSSRLYPISRQLRGRDWSGHLRSNLNIGDRAGSGDTSLAANKFKGCWVAKICLKAG